MNCKSSFTLWLISIGLASKWYWAWMIRLASFLALLLFEQRALWILERHQKEKTLARVFKTYNSFHAIIDWKVDFKLILRQSNSIFEGWIHRVIIDRKKKETGTQTEPYKVMLSDTNCLPFIWARWCKRANGRFWIFAFFQTSNRWMPRESLRLDPIKMSH